MSFPEAAPPSASHRPLRSMEPEFHEKSQPSVAGEDATVAPAPTDSTEIIRSFQQQSLEGGESVLDTLADETLHRGGSVSGLVQKSNSEYPHADPYEADEFVLPHQQHPIERQNTRIPGVNGSGSLSDFVRRRNSVYAPKQQSNRPPGDNGDEPCDETLHRTDSLSGFLQKRNNSVYPHADPYEADEFVVPPAHCGVLSDFLHQRDSVYTDEEHLIHADLDADTCGGLSGFLHQKNSVYTDEEHPIHTDLERPVRDDNRRLGGITVKRLRLFKAVTVPETITIFDAGCEMAAQSADVLVLTDSNGLLSGILTEKDIVKRVIASGIDLVSTPVSKVMTKDPIFVLSDTGVMDAVQKMVQGKVKQSPVIENGEVIGLVRLNKCLFNFKSDDDGVFHGSMNAFSRSKIDADSLVGDSGLTLKQLGLPSVLSLPETTTIYEACCQMAAVRADALVLVDSNALLCGILSSKDIVSLAIPSGIDFVNTAASKVMIKNPASVFSSSLAVEALEKMLQGELTQLLVIENGEPIALLDILSCLSHLFTHRASRGKHDKVIAAGFQAFGKHYSFDLGKY